MDTPAAIAAILDWQAANAGRVQYSETAPTRLASDTGSLLTPTDCSGMAARMFAHFAGLNIGTYTGNECAYGKLVTVSKADAAVARGMLPGDCILFDWDGGAWDHIAIYAGGGRIWNHGGPGNGPLNWSLAASVNDAVKIMVRRFLLWTSDTDTPEVIDMQFTQEQFEAAVRKVAQEVVSNYDAALRGGETTGHWPGDGKDAGLNDRLTRTEHRLGMDKHGKPLESAAPHPSPGKHRTKGN